jgi:hypothetical protein
MADERWQVLSDWLSGWLEAEPQVRLRLRDELAVNHPELIADADRMTSSADSLTGFSRDARAGAGRSRAGCRRPGTA